MYGWYYDNDDDLSHSKRVIGEAVEQGYHGYEQRGAGVGDQEI